MRHKAKAIEKNVYNHLIRKDIIKSLKKREKNASLVSIEKE